VDHFLNHKYVPKKFQNTFFHSWQAELGEEVNCANPQGSPTPSDTNDIAINIPVCISGVFLLPIIEI